MRAYELVLVIKSSLSEAQRKKLLDSIKLWLKDLKIAKEDDWGQKTLSYKIKKETSGYFAVLHLEGENPVVQDLEKRILGQENVLRHLLIRTK
ncbi:MAG: 30S ribosomal protein S6 [Candidatus Levybacteria bacterium]|nr:30S ribosomal protein S6 [Candidatus Levybacteria bacterium]